MTSTTGPMPPQANHQHGTAGALACPICNRSTHWRVDELVQGKTEPETTWCDNKADAMALEDAMTRAGSKWVVAWEWGGEGA